MAQFSRPYITFLLVVSSITTCLSCIVSEIFNVEYWRAHEIRVVQGHWKWHHSIDHSTTSYQSAIVSFFRDIWHWRILWSWNLGSGFTHPVNVHRWNLHTRDYVCAAVIWIYLHLFLYSWLRKKLYSVQSFKVIQCHRNCYHLKVHVRLPISLPL